MINLLLMKKGQILSLLQEFINKMYKSRYMEINMGFLSTTFKITSTYAFLKEKLHNINL